MKTAVLIHGLFLEAEGWETTMWGNPGKGVYGRIPTGLREAIRVEADCIFFPSGASSKDGVSEGAYILAFAREHLSEIPECAEIRDALAWLDARAIVESSSQRTREEVVACGRIARERECERLILVSSPTHILRAHQVALSAFAQDEYLRPLLHGLAAVASDTSYAGTTVDDVLIIEPPHIPGLPKVFFNKTLRPITAFMQRDDLAGPLNDALAHVLEDFKKKL